MNYLSQNLRFEVKNFLIMDLFLTNTKFLLHKTFINGLEWILVMFLSAVWTLILTAPIHSRGSIGEQVMYCYTSPNLF